MRTKAQMKRENPFQHRKAAVSHYRSKMEKHLIRLGAKGIMLGSDVPSVQFNLHGRRYMIDQDPDAFIQAFGAKTSKAIIQAWALLSEYVVAALTRAEINAESPEDMYRYMSSHLLLQDGATTVEDEIVRAISRNDVPLLTTGSESE